MSAEGEKAERKLVFTLGALDAPDPFASEAVVPPDVVEALQWQAGHSVDEVIALREAAIAKLEARGKVLWDSGAVAQWHSESCKGVAASVNGPLMVEVIEALGITDQTCPSLFRDGEEPMAVSRVIAPSTPFMQARRCWACWKHADWDLSCSR